MSRLLFIDAGVLIAAARGTDAVAQRALAVLDDRENQFASSQFIRLEVLPKSLFHRKSNEAAFYAAFFEAVSVWAKVDDDLLLHAYDEAVRTGLSALDALHVAAAVATGADRLVTTEKAWGPLLRTRAVPVQTILSGGQG